MDVFNFLNGVKPEEVATLDKTKEKFLIIYGSKFGNDGAESFYNDQTQLFTKIVRSSEELKKCSNMSLFNTFISIAVNGISIEKNSSTQAYVEASNVKVGVRQGKDGKDQAVYEKMAVLKIAGYGELLIRQRAGQIKYADNPKIVYNCDEFSFGEENDKTIVRYMMKYPRPANAKIIGAFIKLVRPDGSSDYKVMVLEDIQRLMGYSKKNNSHWDGGKRIEGNANALYGRSVDGSDIDTGFLCAKVIKHAFKNFPRIAIGDGAIMQADDDEQPKPIEKRDEDVPFGETQSQGTKVIIEKEDEPF
jgi:hypothetical protein